MARVRPQPKLPRTRSPRAVPAGCGVCCILLTQLTSPGRLAYHCRWVSNVVEVCAWPDDTLLDRAPLPALHEPDSPAQGADGDQAARLAAGLGGAIPEGED